MSKENARFNKGLPERERFYVRCIGLAYGNVSNVARRNWLHAICESRETLREAILLDFLRRVAKEMAKVERHLRPRRGNPPKIEETSVAVADSKALGLSLPETLMNTGSERNVESAKKKAAAIRARRYRLKKKDASVTK